MTHPFMDNNFLLFTETSRELFHNYAANSPIIDYHNHLPPQEIASNHHFPDLSAIWLQGDHYKWRAMRTAGISEKYITGDATPWEKFESWAQTVPQTLRNPLYHWTHMELKRPFGITHLLNPSTAKQTWEKCNAFLATDQGSVWGLLKERNVKILGTTDDPTDSLEHHRAANANPQCPVKMYPTFRPDNVYHIQTPKTWNTWIDQLAQAADLQITTYQHLLTALENRCDHFHQHGARLSDYGLERIHATPYLDSEITPIFSAARNGKAPSTNDLEKFRSATLYELSKMYHARKWTQQFHLGALRNNNSRLLNTLGADIGVDSISDSPQTATLSTFLNRLDQTNQLAQTILYNLNPSQNETFATMIGNFMDSSTPGKLQFGSGWWFMDQRHGMINQLNTLSNIGLLSRFVGMLTDSRSFLSFSRHDYFRRILCDLLGQDVEQGQLPKDIDLLGNMVQDICYNNANNYFGFEHP